MSLRKVFPSIQHTEWDDTPMPIKILASRKVQYIIATIIIKEIKRKASDLLCHYQSCIMCYIYLQQITSHWRDRCMHACMHDLPDQLDYQYNYIIIICNINCNNILGLQIISIKLTIAIYNILIVFILYTYKQCNIIKLL